MTRLVLCPSLGTTVATCWGPTIAALEDRFEVVAFELPGHVGGSGPVPEGCTMSDLAARVLDMVDGPFVYAGDSVGGAIGLQLLLDAPDRVLGAVLCCTAPRFGTAETWADRMAQVRASGTASLVSATAQRWFGPGFAEREPARVTALLDALGDTSEEGYLAVCGALAAFDVRHQLPEITRPVIAVAGAEDPSCPPETLRTIADGVQQGRLVVLEGVAHQAPAEAPEQVARLIRDLAQQVT